VSKADLSVALFGPSVISISPECRCRGELILSKPHRWLGRRWLTTAGGLLASWTWSWRGTGCEERALTVWREGPSPFQCGGQPHSLLAVAPFPADDLGYVPSAPSIPRWWELAHRSSSCVSGLSGRVRATGLASGEWRATTSFAKITHCATATSCRSRSCRLRFQFVPTAPSFSASLLSCRAPDSLPAAWPQRSGRRSNCWPLQLAV